MLDSLYISKKKMEMQRLCKDSSVSHPARARFFSCMKEAENYQEFPAAARLQGLLPVCIMVGCVLLYNCILFATLSSLFFYFTALNWPRIDE